MVQRLLLIAARKSWRFYRSLNFVVDSGGFRIPISNGVGLQVLRDHDIGPALRAIYSYRAGAFVDVGANIGGVMLVLAKIDRSIPYVGFEPLLQAAYYIQRLILENGLQGTHAIYPIALADYCGTSMLMLNEDTDVSATTTPALRPTSMYDGRVPVCVSTGDLILKDLDRIAAIKIDVEGAERQVLSGLRETIRKHRPVLIVEIMPYSHLEDGSYDRSYFGKLPASEITRLVANRKRNQEDLSAFMEDIGYRFLRLGDGQTGLRAAKPPDSTLEDQDFLAFPEEDVPKFGPAPAS